MKTMKFDNPVQEFLSQVFDIGVLNILWLVCSIPVITMGAATTALNYSMLRISRKTESGVIQMFFKSFRENFKQGCLLTIILALYGGLLLAVIQACGIINGIIKYLALILFLLLAITFLIVVSYSFPLLAQFDNTITNTLKNALFMGVVHFKKTVIIALLNVIPIIQFVFFRKHLCFARRFTFLLDLH